MFDTVPLRGKRNVTRWRMNTRDFQSARNRSLLRNLSAKCDAFDAAFKYVAEVEDFVESLRTLGYQGRIIWRTIQINFGFDYYGCENSFKFRANELIRASNVLAKNGAEVLDVEKLTGLRPETYQHQRTNHFYCSCSTDCQCKSASQCDSYQHQCALKARGRCRNTECERLRNSEYDNGEPNRVIAQMLLNAVDDNISAGWDKFKARGSCNVILNERFLTDSGRGSEIDGGMYVIRFGSNLYRRCKETDVGSRTDLYVTDSNIRRTFITTDVDSSTIQQFRGEGLVLILHHKIDDATAPCGYPSNCFRSSMPVPYLNFFMGEMELNISAREEDTQAFLQNLFPFCSSIAVF
mmetsp:Transcript_1518/g.4738  ORF Transcript_1518/g.4738 Transcript_1518/m.4738 type:complete len:351 (-) Transcript_1518:244-1296(-)